MLTNHATLGQTRTALKHELLKTYPEGESSSIASLVLEHLGFPSSSILTHPETIPGADIQAQIKEILKEIHTGSPIQYILGYTWFCDLRLEVKSCALIPRPETEELVYKIVDSLPGKPARIIDLGTGSGCIALALKKKFPDSRVWALEKSREALLLAGKNGKELGLEVEWIEGDIKDAECLENNSFDLMVSNPPYVPQSEIGEMNENVRGFEPHLALFVPDEDPVVFYRAIASLAIGHLEEKGSLWLEIHENHALEVEQVLRKAGFENIIIHKDIHEKDRFIEAERKAHGL